jgi:serine protease Do
MRIVGLIMSVLIACGIGGAIYADSHRAEVMRRVAKSTVVVLASSKTEDSLGSGTVIGTAKGYSFVLTCHHVIEGSDTIAVVAPGDKPMPAFVERDSADRDLALLAVKASLPALPIAATPPALYDTVYVLGAPNGEVGSASEGMVTRLSYALEPDPDGGLSQRFYRVTNAFMMPGISGGTATNTNGELIGVPVRAPKETTQQGLLVAWPDVVSFVRGYDATK